MNRLTFLCVAVLGLTLLAGSAPGEDAPKKGFVGVQLTAQDKVIVVTEVIPEGPAAKAGIRSGDQILKIAGAMPTTLPLTVAVVKALKPGSKVKFLLLRDGKEKEVEVEVGTLG